MAGAAIIRRLLIAGLGLPAFAGHAAEPACGVEQACEIAGGSYRVSPPPAWDGTSPLPATLFFHGWQGSAEDEMGDQVLRAEFGRLGILLVFPDGLGKTWAHQGSPSQARDDIAFTRDVLADVLRRWPVDARRVWASGFSQGGSMVWDLACRGGGFAAYVAISGDFWEPYPEACPAAPVNLLHFHGLADATVPLEGRPLRDGSFRQGDLFRSMAILRAADGCAVNPDGYSAAGGLVIRAWDRNCQSGRRLAMALHPGGHELPEGWVELAWRWIQALPGPATAAKMAPP